MTFDEWIEAFAHAAGLEAPSSTEIEEILNLAGIAAHASERKAAPVTCWIAARAGMSAANALALAQAIDDPKT